MAGVWLWVRSEWRRGWAGLLALGLLIAAAGGVTLAVVAGARRADTAMARFVEETNQPQIEIELAFPENPDEVEPRLASLPTAPELADRVERVPGVEGLTVQNWIAATPDPDGDFFNGGIGAMRGDAPSLLLLDGRWPAPGAVHEAVVGEAAIEEWGITLDQTVPLRSLAPEQFRQWLGLEAGEPEGPVVDVRITGVVRDIEEISDAPEPFLLVTQAFVERYADEVLSVPGVVSVKAAPERVDQVIAELQRAVGEGYRVGPPPEDFAGRVDESVSVEVTALWVFAVAAAATGIIIVYQAMGRHASELDKSRFIRQTLGFTRRDHVLGSIVRLAPAVLLGVVLALALAIALSPLLPRGLARRAEPVPGVLVDRSVLVLGGLAITVVGVLLAAGAGRGRRRGTTASTIAPAALDGLAARVPPTGALGLRFALAPRGRLAEAGWVGITGVALAVGGLLAVAAIDRSVDRLMTTPRLYGAGWDADLELSPAEDVDALVASIASLPEVAAVGRREVLAGDADLPASGPGGTGLVEPVVFHADVGAIAPTLTQGRMPGGPGEVTIGDSVATRLGAGIGDAVEVEGHRGPVSFVVVGTAVTPGTDELGDGFLVTRDGLGTLTTDCPDSSDDPLCSTVTVGIGVRFAPGVDESTAVARLREIDDGFAPIELPSVVHNLGQIGATPWYLAGFLGLLGLAGVAHALTTGSGRRDHDLAVTRAVGFRPAQAARSIRWQAAVLAATGAMLGLLLGVVAGRLVWRRVAEGTGALVETVIPVWAMLAAPVGALAVALVVAGVPAARAAMRRPAELLRTE